MLKNKYRVNRSLLPRIYEEISPAEINAKSQVYAAERQNNLIEQSHRPTRDKEKQQRSFRSITRTQGFLFTHAEINHLFSKTKSQVTACIRKRNLSAAFSFWSELSLSIP